MGQRGWVYQGSFDIDVGSPENVKSLNDVIVTVESFKVHGS